MAQTAREKAQAALDLTERKVARLTKQHGKAFEVAARTERELDEVRKERDYLASHPALNDGIDTEVRDTSAGEPTPEPVSTGSDPLQF